MYKNIKTFVYLILFIFIILMVTLFSAQKSTYDQNNEEKEIAKKMEEQAKISEQYNARNTSTPTQITETQTPNLQNYVDTDINLDNKQQNVVQHKQTEELKNSPKEELSETTQPQKVNTPILKIVSNTNQKFEIIKEFDVKGTNFAIVSKMSEYQSEYSKKANKKYYIYKLKENRLYEVCYIIEFSAPKNINKEDLFTITMNNYDTIEITANMLNNASRKFSKQTLLTAPLIKAKSIEVEQNTQTQTATAPKTPPRKPGEPDIYNIKRDAIFNLPAEK